MVFVRRSDIDRSPLVAEEKVCVCPEQLYVEVVAEVEKSQSHGVA